MVTKMILSLMMFNILSSCFIKKEGMTNLEIIKSTYEGKTSEENGKNLASHVSENISWTEAAGFPYAGTYVGLENIAKGVFSRLANEWIDYKFVPENYVADGDTVVAYGTYKGTYKATNKYFEARVAHIWKLKEGKIISFEQFVDIQAVNNAMK
jgi:ketosteroid isomerase-like protein